MVKESIGEAAHGQTVMVPDSSGSAVGDAARSQSADHSGTRSVQSLISKLLKLPSRQWRQRESVVNELGDAASNERDRRIAASVLCGVLENSPRESVLARFARGSAWAFLIILLGGYLIARPLMVHWFPEIDSISALLKTNPSDPRIVQFYDSAAIRTFILWNQVINYASIASGLVLSFWFDKLRYRRLNRVRSAAAKELGRLAVPESVGALAHAMMDKDAIVRKSARDAARDALPHLASEHHEIFDSEAIKNLGRALLAADADLSNPSDSSFEAINLLDALDKIGTSQALPHVEHLVARGSTPEVRGRAAQVRQTLKDRATEESDRDRLLRPAATIAASESVLLRPAAGVDDTDSLLLLRPSECLNDER